MLASELTNAVYAASDDGSSHFGSLTLTYDITYYEYAIRKNTQCYDDLKQIGVEWNVGDEKQIVAFNEYTFEQGE